MRDADPAIAPSDIDAVVRHGKTLLLAVPQTAGIGKRLSRRIRETIASLMAVNLAGRRPGKIRGFVAPAPPAAQACIGRSADQRASGFGRARTARGELVHRVLLERDGSGRETVAGWGLDAPTDRLFVNQGPVVEALEQLRAEGDAQLRQLAALTVLSFDPCFEYWLALTEVEEDDA